MYYYSDIENSPKQQQQQILFNKIFPNKVSTQSIIKRHHRQSNPSATTYSIPRDTEPLFSRSVLQLQVYVVAHSTLSPWRDMGEGRSRHTEHKGILPPNLIKWQMYWCWWWRKPLQALHIHTHNRRRIQLAFEYITIGFNAWKISNRGWFQIGWKVNEKVELEQKKVDKRKLFSLPSAII